MPTAINPNNYNIDFFQTYSFGEITDNSYLTYLFGQNLQSLPDELVNGPAGNFTSKYNEKGLEKDINYTTITNPGSIDEWLVEGNFPVNLFEVSYQNPSQNVGTNQYGPSSLQAFNYENPELIVEDTGFIQYPTSVGGNPVVNLLLSEGLDAVGLSSNNFIDFDSPLDKIGKERRLEEAKIRLRDGIIENTVGRINLDPLGLLAGQPLFGKDYTITKPAGGVLGDVINFASDVAGINTQALTTLFGGPLPEGAFDWDAPLDDPFSVSTIDITEKLLERTGKGTKNLLFDALSVNKYGPVIEGQNSSLSEPPKSSDSNQSTQKGGYLAYGEIQKVKEQTQKDVAGTTPATIGPLTEQQALSQNQQNSGLNLLGVDNTANKSAKDITGNLPSTDGITNNDTRNTRPDVPLEPKESENPSLALKTTDALKFQGFEFEPNGAEFDPTYNNYKDGWDRGHTSNWKSQYGDPQQITTYGSETQWGSELGNDGPEPGPRVWNKDLYWKDGRTEGLPKRGLLNYTQKLINKSTNVNGTAGRFIGMPNSDQNYELQGKGTDRRHVEMSMGNLVKDTKPNADGKEPYCRSWSVRNAYNKYDNLIRYDGLWRLDQPGTIKSTPDENDPARRLGNYSVLKDPGVVKIAYEKDGIDEELVRSKRQELNSSSIPENLVIPYMFSIENLAWKDSPHYKMLPLCEKGPHGGRIMWFPPYNINFTDNTSVNWDTTNFIGRAEPIYTYNNTERTGTLSFSIVVDHPSILNKLRNGELKRTVTDEQGNTTTNTIRPNLETFFAGCNTDEIKEILREVPFIPPPILEETPVEEKPKEYIIPTPPEIVDKLSFHFKNSRDDESKGFLEKDVNTNGYEGQPNIVTNSSCPDGLVGRCFDTNYEKVTLEAYDNPKLYTGGANAGNTTFSCDEKDITTIIPELITTESSELVVIPANFPKPPCSGFGSNKKYGPWVNKPTDKRWVDGGDPKGNYCCTKIPNTFTSGSTTYKANEVGYYIKRYGANERFWGTNPYPYPVPQERGKTNTSGEGASPKLDLTGIELPNKFVAQPNGVAGFGISQLIEFLATTELGKNYTINVIGNCSNFGGGNYNKVLGQDRANSVKEWLKSELIRCETENGGAPKLSVEGFEPIDLFSEKGDTESCGRWKVQSKGKDEASNVNGNAGDNSNNASAAAVYTLTPAHYHPTDPENNNHIMFRRVDIFLTSNTNCVKPAYDKLAELEKLRVQGINEANKTIVDEKNKQAQAAYDAERQKVLELAKGFINECDYFETIKKTDSFLYESLTDKLKNFHPAFHAITPEGLNSRLTFLQQCGRQGPSFIDPNQPQNTAFGRPPVCILRIGDFYFTKIIIDSINFTFDPLQWDLNPEGIGVQPMVVNVDMNFKFIGGSTLQGPLRQLQNAVSYNFFANTAIYMPLQKILAKRQQTGFLVESDEGYNEDSTIPETFYYGPWASQTIADETIKADQEARQTLLDQLDQQKAAEEEDNAEQIEDSNPCPCTDGKGSLATKEDIDTLKNSPEASEGKNVQIVQNYEAGNKVWKCEDGTWVSQPSEENNPLNTVPGEETPKELQEVTVVGTTNKTMKETGTSPFYESNPNFKSLLSSSGEQTNEYGSITYQGPIRNTTAGEGTFFEGGFNILGFIPHYIYSMLTPEAYGIYNYYITNTYDDGGAVGGGTNNAYVYNGNDGKASEYSCCKSELGNPSNLPAREASEQIAAFNLLRSLTGYDTLKEWKNGYTVGGFGFPSVGSMEELGELINNSPNKTYSLPRIKYGIKVNKKDSSDSITDFIKIDIKITKVGYDRLIKILTEN
jgi:hypothetical protein